MELMGFIQKSLPASPTSDDRTPFLTKHSGHAQHRPAPQQGPIPGEPEARGAQAPHRSFTHPRGEHPCPRQDRDHGALSSRPHPLRPDPTPPGPLQARPAPAVGQPRTPRPGAGRQDPSAGGAGPAQPVPCPRAASSAPAGRHGLPPRRGTWNCSSFSVCSAVSSRSSGAAILLPPLTRRSVTLRN